MNGQEPSELSKEPLSSLWESLQEHGNPETKAWWENHVKERAARP
jgi:hypothetical protein